MISKGGPFGKIWKPQKSAKMTPSWGQDDLVLSICDVIGWKKNVDVQKFVILTAIRWYVSDTKRNLNGLGFNHRIIAAKIFLSYLFCTDIHAKGVFYFLPIGTAIILTLVMLALSTLKIVCGDDNSSNEENEEWYVLCIKRSPFTTSNTERQLSRQMFVR